MYVILAQMERRNILYVMFFLFSFFFLRYGHKECWWQNNAIYNFTEIFQWTRNALDFQIQKVSARYFRHTLSGHM